MGSGQHVDERTTPAAGAAHEQGDTLVAGEVLEVGHALRAPSGEVSALMREDGAFVLQRDADGQQLWSSDTQGSAGAVVVMGDDGRLSVTAGGRTLWSTDTDGHPGAFAQLHRDGRLVVHDFYRAPLWSADQR